MNRIRGMAATKRALQEVQARATVAAPVAARAGGDVLASEMRDRAPRDTGALAASIGVSMEGDTAKVGASVPYDRFVQLGTQFQAQQAYGEEGARASVAGIVTAQAAVFKRAIE